MSSINVNLTRERHLRTGFAELGRARMQNRLAELQEQMTTGRRINRASDDATGYAQAKKLTALGDRHQQYQHNIEMARSWVTHTQDHLGTMAELIQQAHEYGIRGINDASSDEDRETYASRIEQLRDELIDQLNAKVGDEYVFAGNQSDQPPFYDIETAPTVPNDVGLPTSATVSGDRIRRIGQNTQIATNIDGDTIHDVGGGVTLANSLTDLVETFRDPTSTRAQLEDAVGNADSARDHIIELEAHMGDVAHRLDISADQLEQKTITNETLRSKIEDTDFLEATTQFQQEQTHLQAALSATASIMQTSLLDYLR